MLKNNNRLAFIPSPSIRLPKIQTPLTQRKGKENVTRTVFLEFPIGKKKPIKNQSRENSQTQIFAKRPSKLFNRKQIRSRMQDYAGKWVYQMAERKKVKKQESYVSEKDNFSVERWNQDEPGEIFFCQFFM